MTEENTSRDEKGAPDNTGQKQALTQFRPGQSGNSKGRPKGARSRLGEQFIEALANDFDEHGNAVIEKVRVRDPVAFLKLVANVLPREVLVKAFNVNATVDLSAIEAAQGFLEAYRFARDRIGAAPLIEVDEGAMVTEGWRADD